MSTADEIEVRVVQAADHESVLDFLRLHYYAEEPLTIGSEPKQQDDADEKFNMSNIDHGTCLMAIHGGTKSANYADGAVVGAVLAGPKEPNEAEHMFEEAAELGPTKWGHILQFLACVERDANVCRRYSVDKALHAHVLAVDQKMRGKGVGALLMRNLFKLGRSKDYPLLTTDCTSLYSALLCERLGMECVNTADYTDYKDATGKQVFCPPAPHSCVKTYALRL